ncbi:phage antirepressor KilAC domain-containing protein [Paenibacillus sp. NPDC058177]|uniref:phage antirepressor KilAC domain-containing protein n=1 Tax=Paenibacillus sp. NPDC058177 TaxID=3346369 RepID=UPI0036DCBAA8
MSTLIPVEHKGQRVLLSSQLADSYQADRQQISYNYNQNKKRYIEGKHYYILQGDEKREFLDRHEIHDGSKNAVVLYLWTEKGAWLHAKSLNTDRSWEAYEMLVDDYYRVKGEAGLQIPQSLPEALRLATDLAEQKQALLLESQKKDQLIQELKPKADYTDVILQNKGLVNVNQIAKDYGMSATAFNKLLHEFKVQYKQGEQWLLYSNYDDKGYVHSDTINIVRSDGRPDVNMRTKWTQKGRFFLYEFLKNEGIIPVIERTEEAISIGG